MLAYDASGGASSFALDLGDSCANFPCMHRTTQLLLILLIVIAPGCTSIVGDACVLDADCGTGLVCDAAQPEGYCTRTNCEEQSCPDEGICVAFDSDTSYCMRPCSEDSECREAYVCIDDFGLHPFCGIAR